MNILSGPYLYRSTTYFMSSFKKMIDNKFKLTIKDGLLFHFHRLGNTRNLKRKKKMLPRWFCVSKKICTSLGQPYLVHRHNTSSWAFFILLTGSIKINYERRAIVSPESDGVTAKSNWGSNKPAAMGIATTLYATAQDRFWWTFAIVARARSSASTNCHWHQLRFPHCGTNKKIELFLQEFP